MSNFIALVLEVNTSNLIAANEMNFAPSRFRNAPIKSSLTSIRGLPDKLKIFRISGSKYWQLRLYNHGKYTTRSLKTTDLEEAKKFARDFFESLQEAGVYKIKLPKSIALRDEENQRLLFELIQEILNAEAEKVKRDAIKHGSYLMTKNRLEGHVFTFFKQRPLNKINTVTLEDFVSYLTHQALSAATIQGYMAQVRKVLLLLNRRGLLAAIPPFPKVTAYVHSRGAFTVNEYQDILRKSKQLRTAVYADWVKDRKVWIKSAFHQMPVEMNWLIRFMVYTFVRPGDIRQIKNRHIEIIQGKHNYLRLNLPEVKRHNAATVSLPPAVNVYKSLLAHQTARGYGGEDDYVFFPEESNRRLILDIVGWLFNWILHDLGIKRGPHGTDRTLYSLRHTAITFRLIYGGSIDLLTLARNARTSVEMIEKFYASTLSAEMNIALLHGKRR